MIGALTGTVFSSSRNPLILMVGGVGYRVFITEKLGSLVKTNETITLFTHLHVREDALDLYGFGQPEELALFALLITVSGIGPRTGLAIISRGVTPIQKAVTSSDVTFFTTIPRVGKKNAQKIIIELKTKLGSIADLNLAENLGDETKDVLDALTGMGFGRSEVLEAIKNLNPEVQEGVEEKIRHALRLLGKP